MEPCNVSFEKEESTFKLLDESLYKNVKYTFETKKSKPTNYTELKELYVFMLKQLSSKELILTKRSYKKENRKEMTYRLDEAYIKYHIDLSTYKKTIHLVHG